MKNKNELSYKKLKMTCDPSVFNFDTTEELESIQTGIGQERGVKALEFGLQVDVKGYNATSIEEITATVGVAKGTLYYHFSSKEEIFNFLIDEGMKLLQNSIDIKTAKYSNYIDKLKAIILIQIKIVVKYEDLITILLSQFLGKEQRNIKCKKHILDYVSKIENIVAEGIKVRTNKKWESTSNSF